MLNMKDIEKAANAQTKRLAKGMKIVKNLHEAGALEAWLTLSCRGRDAEAVLLKVTEPGSKFEFNDDFFAPHVRYYSTFAECWFVWSGKSQVDQFVAEEKATK